MYGCVQCKEVFNIRKYSVYGGVQCKDVFKVWMCLMHGGVQCIVFHCIALK